MWTETTEMCLFKIFLMTLITMFLCIVNVFTNNTCSDCHRTIIFEALLLKTHWRRSDERL